MEVKVVYIITAICALKDNYIWSIGKATSGYCVIVDPGDANAVLNHLNNHRLKLEAILITHHHWDHTNGVKGILQKHTVPVYSAASHSSLEKAIKLPKSGLDFNSIPIPGHTLDHLAFYTPGLVFCGDTLFTGGCGRIFEGTAEQMYNSLMTLAALPDDTLVYCGHEYTESNIRFALTVEPKNEDILKRLESTISLRTRTLPTVPASIALEKKTNPFLRVHVPSVIEAAEKHVQRTLKSPVEVLEAIRAWKDRYK